MKKAVVLIFLVSLFTFGYSQETQVPYRIANKFRLGNSDGKISIAAEYDILEPENYGDYNYFIGYKLLSTEIKSSLIYKNKIILKDKSYSNYYIINGLVIAIEYKLLTKPNYFKNDDHNETKHLYDLNGNKFLNGDFKGISIIDDIDDTNKTDDILIYTNDMNTYESLYLYNKKAKKITKTFIDNAKVIDVNFNYSDNYKDRSITNIYSDKNGIGKKMILELKNNSIVIKSDELIDYGEQKNQIDSRYKDDYPLAIMEPDIPIIAPNSQDEKRILTVRKIEQKRDFYYLPKKIEELKIFTETLKESEQFIVSKNGKQGLFQVYSDKFIVPIEYDEIIFANFEGRNGGYILKNDMKYGFFIYDYPNNKTVKPVFDKMPLMVRYNYFGDKKPLFKLYDENGKLFCYANENGILFYKP